MLGRMDVGLEAHRVAEAHLVACWEAFWHDEEYGPHGPGECEEHVEWPEKQGGPFDGCNTCVTREVLWAAFPVLEEYYSGVPADKATVIPLRSAHSEQQDGLDKELPHGQEVERSGDREGA